VNKLKFKEVVDLARIEQDKLLDIKGHDYTQGNGDRLFNFKEVATMTGLTPLQVWSIYWLKHVFAICTFVKDGKVRSEAIDSRFYDENNYNLLGLALIQEARNATTKGSRKVKAKVTNKKMSKLRTRWTDHIRTKRNGKRRTNSNVL